MSLEIRPLGVKCNIQCQYCYQDPQRDAGNVTKSYDLDKIKAAVRREGGGPFSLFGGEPLLLPLSDLEDLLQWGFLQFGKSNIQTNGTLITMEHVRLFKKYNVRVGLSLDGPEELNDIRWHGSLRRTRTSTAKSQSALELLCRQGLSPSVIVTLHRHNARGERLGHLMQWFVSLDTIGVRNARLHLLESENELIRQAHSLTDEENIRALLALASLQADLPHLRFDIFRDMYVLLAGLPEPVTCVWSGCDPYTTPAVRGIEGDGHRSNCGRTNKDGVDFVKTSNESFERYLALYSTSQDDGGCSGCRFFLMCRGQCPGTAIDGDWRNRTEHCAVWKSLYAHLEAEMLTADESPLSLDPRLKKLESTVIRAWRQGENMSVAEAVRNSQGQGNLFLGACL